MTYRPIRVALLLLFLGAMGAAAYLFWIAEREARSTETTARSFDARAHAAEAQVADLRLAQQAYVAAGQGQDFWFTRGSKALEDLRTAISDLRSTTAASASVAASDEALSLLQDFEQMDGRARDYTRSHQASVAADLIFSDGFDLTRKVADAIERARVAERDTRDAQIAALRKREVFSQGAAAAAALLIVLLLFPAATDGDSIAVRIADEPVRTLTGPRPVANLGVDGGDVDGWSPAKPDKMAAQAREPALEPVVELGGAAASAPPASVAEAAPAPLKSRVDLPRVSALCNDLARVTDTRSLPSLLERAAAALDAAGIVLWVADPDGRELAAIMAHGYAQNIVVRLGAIPRDAENATAAAFRTSLVQTVNADSASNGAIAAPLVGASGCVGVMAAEVRGRGEQDDTVLAAAGIIAAQLATLVAPPSSRAKAEAAG
jgi:CHASE3 domain sensor protein